MNILIVDDDIMIRKWLSMLLTQLGNDTINIYEAANTSDALKKLNSNCIDLMFTDICMPGKSGLELIKSISTSMPSIKVVVLSAYDDYLYVRQALLMGAIDYILKPELTVDIISSILDEIKIINTKIEDQSENDINQSKLFDRYLSEMLSGKLCDVDFFNMLTENADQKAFNIICCYFDKTVSDYSVFTYMDHYIQSISTNDSLNHTVFSLSETAAVILCESDYSTIELQSHAIDRTIILLNNMLSSKFGISVTFNEIAISVTQKKFHIVLTDCLRNLQSKTYYNNNSAQFRQIDRHEAQSQLREIAKKIEARHYHEATVSFNHLIKYYHDNQFAPKDIISTVINGITLFYTYTDLQFDSSIEIDSVNQYTIQLNSAETVSEVDAIVNTFIESYTAKTNISTSNMSSQMRNAINYINENFDKKLSLEDVASHIYINPSYFSLMFKKQIGLPFSDYLENIRLLHAKDLLINSDSTIMEISELSGFSSQNYFSTVFKKKVGVPPLKYRSLYKNASVVS